MYRTPGPHFKGATDAIAVDMHYYNFVDRFNTLGLGLNVPLANGTNSDSLLALQPDGRWVVLRVPYPLGFFSRGMDGRIDDPECGMEGARPLRRLWSELRVAHRGRQGHAQLRGEVPIAARSAGEVKCREPSKPLPSSSRSVALGASPAARAQMDLAGMWAQRFHEELPERGAGPEIGDYAGLPVNDAARLRADSWDAAKWTVPERQCEPHPADYAPRGPASLRIGRTVDPISQDVISWDVTVMWMLPQRTIYMDGRARPSQYAQHSWQGFSTGEWDGDMLKVTTTHLKEAWLRRNGLPRSDRATIVEYWIRNDDYLTLVTVVTDPVYLTEPLVRTSDWVLDPGLQLSPFSCIPDRRDRAAARGGTAPSAGHQRVPDRVRDSAWVASSRRARRRVDDVSGLCAGVAARDRGREVRGPRSRRLARVLIVGEPVRQAP